MTLLFTDSFDIGDYLTKWSPFGTMLSWIVSGLTAFAGGSSLMRQNNGGGDLRRAVTPSGTLVVGFRMMYTANYSGYNPVIMGFLSDSLTLGQIVLTTSNTNDQLMVQRGIGGTQLGSNFTFARNTWAYIEMKVVFHATTGSVEIKKDGTVVFSYSGSTRVSGTATLLDGLYMGPSTNATGISIVVDDLYCLNTSGSVNNDYLGDIRVLATMPSGAGASTQWTPSSGSNYDAVNDNPITTASYVQSGTAGQRDTYDMPALPTVTSAAISGASISASSTYSTETASKAQDADFGTGWCSNGVAANSWLMLDLGVDTQLSGYLMAAGAGTAGSVARSIASWKIQGATAAAPSTWVDIDVRAYAWVVGEVKNWLFSSTVTYRYVRILVVAGGVGNDGYVGTSEFRVFGVGGTIGSVKGVQVASYAGRSDAGSASFKHAVKSSSVLAYGATRATPFNPASFVDVFESDPNTSAAWTTSGVAAMEIGVEAV